MSEDGEKDQEKNEETSSRPVSASARRKQRSSGDAAAGGGGSGDSGGKRPAPKGKASGGARASSGTRDKVLQGKAKTEGKTEPTPKRDGKGRERESLFRRVVRFLREVWGELKKVVWPTRKQMSTYTAVVLVFLAFMIALVFGLDYVWGQAVSLVFGD